MDLPETRYAKSGDMHIAYQVRRRRLAQLRLRARVRLECRDSCGKSPVAHIFSRLAAFSRLIVFDKRGTGLSDRMAGIANLEDRMDDVRAVMDAAGCERRPVWLIRGRPDELVVRRDLSRARSRPSALRPLTRATRPYRATILPSTWTSSIVPGVPVNTVCGSWRRAGRAMRPTGENSHGANDRAQAYPQP